MNAYRLHYYAPSPDPRDYGASVDTTHIEYAMTAQDALAQFAINKRELVYRTGSSEYTAPHVLKIETVRPHELIEIAKGRCFDPNHLPDLLRVHFGISSGEKVERHHTCPTCRVITTYELSRSGDDHCAEITGAIFP